MSAVVGKNQQKKSVDKKKKRLSSYLTTKVQSP